MTDIIAIAINKLDADPRNVRKTYSSDSIESLAASIRANGVLQNIIVRKAPKGRYFVTAGGRRLAALKLLAEDGDIAKDYAVNAMVKQADDATEISLTENCMREAMHPADQYEAFKVLADEGRTTKEIAARFGTTEIIVNRRLALARVSPVLIDLYRNEDMDFNQLAAFTISDDHARQEEVWNSLQSWDRSVHTIKRLLTAEEVPASDKRITFIGGLDAYEAAGGPVRRDLFSENGGGFACDSGLLEKLVLDRLAAEADEVKAEGWKWVEYAAAQPDGMYCMGRVYPQTVDLSEADQAALDQLQAEYDDLAELIEAGAADEEAETRLDEVETAIAALNARAEAYQPEDLALAGAFLNLDYYGRLSVSRGLVRDEDAVIEPDENGDEDSDISEQETAEPANVISHSTTLIEDLTAQKTAALRVELANNADIALVAVVHAMLLGVTYRSMYGATGAQSALQINLTHERLEGSMKKPDANPALEQWESLKENYGHKLPGDPADLWEWLLDQSRDELLTLMAYAVAHSVNAVETKYSGDRKQAFAHADLLGQSLNVKMGDYFIPTGENYFCHLNRKSIEAAIGEAMGAEAALAVKAAAKKGEAVQIAERLVKGSGWFPAHIRIAPAAVEDEGQNAEIHPFPVAAE